MFDAILALALILSVFLVWETLAKEEEKRKEMKKVVVTRHPALVKFLVEHGIVPEGTPVLTHVTEEEIAGRHVFGVLPLHLAAKAAKVTEIPLKLTPAHRGRELTLEEVEELASPPRTYTVREE